MGGLHDLWQTGPAGSSIAAQQAGSARIGAWGVFTSPRGVPKFFKYLLI